MPEIGTEQVGRRVKRSPDESLEQVRLEETVQRESNQLAVQEERDGAANPNELGLLIQSEVDRAERRLDVIRSRAQSVLTASGALVTLLAAVIALSTGEDPSYSFSTLTKTSALVALIAFVSATFLVLAMYLPANVRGPSSTDLARFAQTEWNAATWEQDVAIVRSKFLLSLRTANRMLATYLRAAIVAEVLGIVSTAVMALSLLPPLS